MPLKLTDHKFITGIFFSKLEEMWTFFEGERRMEDIRGFGLSPIQQEQPSPQGFDPSPRGFDESHTEDTEMYQPVTQIVSFALSGLGYTTTTCILVKISLSNYTTCIMWQYSDENYSCNLRNHTATCMLPKKKTCPILRTCIIWQTFHIQTNSCCLGILLVYMDLIYFYIT